MSGFDIYIVEESLLKRFKLRSVQTMKFNLKLDRYSKQFEIELLFLLTLGD